MDAIERVKVHYNNTSDRSIVIDSGDIVIVTTKDGKTTNTYIAVTDQANSDYRYFFNLNDVNLIWKNFLIKIYMLCFCFKCII